MRNIIKKYLSNLVFFYRYIGNRIFILVFLNLVIAVLDGFGLSMFLPLLQMVDNPNNVDPEGLGKLSFLLNFIGTLGFSLTIKSILLLMIFFFTLKGLFKYTALVYGVGVRQLFARKLRVGLISELNRIEFKRFVETDPGRIQNVMTGEVLKVLRGFINYFRSLENLVMTIVYFGFAFFVDFRFAILVTLGGILSNILYAGLYKFTKRASIKVSRKADQLQGYIIQHINQYKYLKATGLLKSYSEKVKLSIYDLERNNKKIGIYNAISVAAREPILVLIVTIVIIIQTEFMGAELAPILISLIFFYRALTSLIAMQNSWNTFLAVSGSVVNVANFLKDLRGMKEKGGSSEFKGFYSSITCEDLSISFGEKKVLKNINLIIKKNETFAIVGESGSGKSTLVNIISGLLPPDKGKLMIDNINYAKLNIASFQKHIGYITQEPVIFNDTIFNNITFWSDKNEDSIERFNKVIRQTSLLNFVNELPDKEQTLLGNNGINLSGGQKQRVSIARELFKNSEILILDEATASLDSETEKLIQESIDNLKGKYTIIVIAHRLSTIRRADRVALMDKGQIVNILPFDELMKKEPKFKSMVELQKL